MKKRTPQVFDYTGLMSNSFYNLNSHLNEMTSKEREIVEGIGKFASTTGKITLRQLQTMGAIYKKYVQDGEYRHHNWRIWKK